MSSPISQSRQVRCRVPRRRPPTTLTGTASGHPAALFPPQCPQVLDVHVRCRRLASRRRLASLVVSCCPRFWNMFVVYVFYTVATYADAYVDPQSLSLPHPALYSFARFSVWALYGFWAGLFATGLWVVGHEAGHQAFSDSKAINNTVGWTIHSA